MSWKKDFARNIRIGELPDIGTFKMSEIMPEPLGGGKYRVTLILADGTKAKMSTYDGTIGDIIYTNVKSGWVKAFTEKVGDKEYIRFKAAEK